MDTLPLLSLQLIWGHNGDSPPPSSTTSSQFPSAFPSVGLWGVPGVTQASWPEGSEARQPQAAQPRGCQGLRRSTLRGHPGPTHTPPGPQDRDRDPSRAGHWTQGRRCHSSTRSSVGLAVHSSKNAPPSWAGTCNPAGPKVGEGEAHSPPVGHRWSW